MTYEVRGEAIGDSGFTQQAFQVKDGFINASEYRNFDVTENEQTFTHTFTVDRNCDRFLINFGGYAGTLYIDDLKLVRVRNQ